MRSFTLLTLLLLACGEEDKSSEPATEPSNEVVDTDSDGDGVIDSEDAFPDDPNESVDVDEDGVGANADCDDEDSTIGSNPNDADCDGFTTDEDCDDNDPTINPNAEEIWYDGTDQNCDGLSDYDQDMDGVRAINDCDDTDPSIMERANDADCDGTLTVDDCNDDDPNSTILSEDADCDGFTIDDDCDDNDSSSTVIATDADCDGVITNEDCDDNDPHSTLVSEDADCDGVITNDDCDDNDTSLGSTQYDADCDGAITNEDCDDTDTSLGSNLVDTDCDGTIDVFEICGDGIDNDYNGLMDCEDAQCFSDPTCFETCADGIDNDVDGLTDCDDDECWGTGSCTNAYTLIQQGTGFITVYGNGFNINNPCTIGLSNYCMRERTLRATNFVGELRIPTGPDTFQQCFWTTNASASMYSSAQFTSQIMSNGTTTTGWVSNTHRNFRQLPLTRTNMTVDANCPFTTSSMISQFLGTTWRRSYYQGVYMPQHNQWVDWYKPGSIVGSPSCPSCTSMYNVEVGHKLDF